jgi:hypothetical protein
MANEANPLDDFLRGSTDSASFPFNEDHWKQMEARLDDERPKQKRRFLLPWWKGVALSVIGIGMGLVLWKIPQATRSQAHIETITSPTPKQTAQPIPATNTLNEASHKHIDPETGTITTRPVSAKLVSPTNKPNSHKAPRLASTNKAPLQSAPLAQSGSMNMMDNRDASNSKVLANQTEKSVLPEKVFVPKTAQLIQGKAMQAIDTQVQTHRRPMSEEEMIRHNPRYRAALQQYVPEQNDSVTVIRFKPVEKTVAQVYNSALTDTNLARYRLQLFVGSMLWRGFIGGNTWSPAPYLSIGLEKTVSKRLTMATQVGFTYFASLQTQNRSISYRYKFGIDSSVYTALHRMVFRIQWPIQFQYAINKEHALMLGAGAAWQPDGLSRVTAPQQVLSGGGIPSGNAPLVSKNTLGYLHGIRAWDVFFQAGYQWQWHERMALQVLWQAGLRDMTNNTILSSNRIQRNNGLMVGLRYSFVRSNRK